MALPRIWLKRFTPMMLRATTTRGANRPPSLVLPATTFRAPLPDLEGRAGATAAAPGAALNLERALAADGRNSGHLVQGHVDDVGTIEAMVPDGEALTVRDAERDPRCRAQDPCDQK